MLLRTTVVTDIQLVACSRRPFVKTAELGVTTVYEAIKSGEHRDI